MRKRETPRFVDACGHGIDTFIGTFKVFGGEDSIKYYDLYVFPSDLHGMEVCIRYGNEGYEYISPGSIMEFCRIGGNGNRHKVYEEGVLFLSNRIKITDYIIK